MFDTYGNFHGELPADCVRDCSHAGQCDADVAFWRAQLDFQVPRDLAIAYLAEFGAWERADLMAKGDDDLADIVLWIACGDLRESGEWFGLIH